MSKPLGKVKIVWSPEFAYAIGLLATDGCLSPDGRHIDFTSKDREQIKNFLYCLGIKVKIGSKHDGYGYWAYRVQFGDVLFYKFLQEIGFTPRKSKTIGALQIPRRYFLDFLRGHFDGDGTFYSYWDPRWRASFMFYTTFVSASHAHIVWLRREITRFLPIKGHVSEVHGKQRHIWYQFRFAKRESLILLRKLYYANPGICLRRKYLKIQRALSIIGMSLK